MKSIIEEASSVVKAIEKGWAQAGKPAEFSIKVFEVEQKNFLGMTTKSAKVAIFYGHKNPSLQGAPHTEHYESHEKKGISQSCSAGRSEATVKKNIISQENTHTKSNSSVFPKKPQETTAPVKKEAPKYVAKKPVEQVVQKDIWTKEMIDAASDWLTEIIKVAQLPHAQFTTEAKNYFLKFSFEDSLFAQPENERLFFRSTAHLIVQALRNKFKKSFRGFKVILNSKTTSSVQ